MTEWRYYQIKAIVKVNHKIIDDDATLDAYTAMKLEEDGVVKAVGVCSAEHHELNATMGEVDGFLEGLEDEHVTD